VLEKAGTNSRRKRLVLWKKKDMITSHLIAESHDVVWGDPEAGDGALGKGRKE